MFHQTLKGVYKTNVFETWFMVVNDDLKGKTTQ